MPTATVSLVAHEMGQSGFRSTGRLGSGVGNHTDHPARAIELALPATDGVTQTRVTSQDLNLTHEKN